MGHPTKNIHELMQKCDLMRLRFAQRFDGLGVPIQHSTDRVQFFPEK